MLLSSFLIASDWSLGNHATMEAYLAVTSLVTVGLLWAVLFFWSSRPLLLSVAIVSNVTLFLFALLLAVALLIDKHPDPSPMLVGFSRQSAVSISTTAWGSYLYALLCLEPLPRC